MSKLKKRTEVSPVNPITEVAIFRHFPIYDLLIIFMIMLSVALIISLSRWITSLGSEPFSIKVVFFTGVVFTCIFHLPSFLSALIMNWLKKPILRFDADGFYYTPQIWSKSPLYEWDTIKRIKIERRDDSEKGYKCIITIYLTDGRRVHLNEKIMPIKYNKLLKIFRYRIKNVPVKVINN